MNVQKNQVNQTNDNMCKRCKVFYASESFDGFCSGCFKYQSFQARKNHDDKKEELQIKETFPNTQKIISVTKNQNNQEKESIQQIIQKDRKRCFDCNKKVGLLGIECRCGFIYCKMHRLPENHNCRYDFEQQGKKKLEKQIIKVYNGKISQI